MYVILCAAGLARSCIAIVRRPHDSYESLWVDLVVDEGWPPVLWLICLNCFAIPIRCAFRPPPIANNSQLLKKDPVRRASYPDEVQQAGADQMLGGQTICYTLIVVYVFVLSFYNYYA